MSAAELKVVMSLKDEVSAGIKKMSQQMKTSIDSIKQYFVGVTAAAAAVTTAIMALQKTWNFLNMAAQAKQQEEAFRSLTASYGISANELIKRLKEASAETINTSNIMKQASTAIFQGISPDKLVQLMEGARAAARIAGEDIEDTFNQIVEAISSGLERGILRQRGLLRGLDQAYKDYALSIYGVVKPLSSEEEITVRLNVALGRLLDLKKGVNLEYKTELENLQSVKSIWAELGEQTGKFVLSVVMPTFPKDELNSAIQKAKTLTSEQIANLPKNIFKITTVPI